MIGGLSVQMTASFERDFNSLPRDIQVATVECIEDLAANPIPARRRIHSVSPQGHKPTIYSADVTSNKAYKLTFQIDSRLAILRRVGTHRQIDRRP